MNGYLLIKTLHIVSSVLLVGTGFGSAFYLYFANRLGSLPAQALVCRLVKRADLWFTTPAVIIQPLSGFWMAESFGSFAVYNGAWQPYTDLASKLRSNQTIPLPDGPITGEYVERCESLALLGELLPWSIVEPGWFVVQGSKGARTAFFMTKPNVGGVHYLLGKKVPVENLTLANTLPWNEWN